MRMFMAVLFLGLVSSLCADTLTFRNGTSVTGNWLGGSAGKISFAVDGQVKVYSQSEVTDVTFGSGAVNSTRTPELPPIAPPPPPAKDPITVGQTVDQIEAALGKPAQVVSVALKKIYIYKDPPLKITFKDGKVADVE